MYHYSKSSLVGALLPVLILGTQAQNVTDALFANTQTALFASLVQNVQGIQELITTSPKSPTILAPSNDALNAFAAKMNYSSVMAIPKGMMITILSYHVLTDNYSTTDLSTPIGVTAMSQLKGPDYALLPNNASQSLYAWSSNGTTVSVSSGLSQTVSIVKGDSVYDNGTIHVVDGLLTLPKKCSSTLQHAGATELLKYLNRTNLIDPLDKIPGATCFAPSDRVFKSMTKQLENLTDAQLTDMLMTHVADTVLYLTDFKDGQVFQTHTGVNVTVTIKDDNTFYFNGIKALSVRNIAQNGVAYVIDGVLNSTSDSTTPLQTSPLPTTAVSTSVTAGAATPTSGTPTTGGSTMMTGTNTAPASSATTSKPSAASLNYITIGPAFVAVIIALLINSL